MQDITDVFRESLPILLRNILLIRNDLVGESNYMNSRIVHCNSLEELAKHYEEIKPCYAYVHSLRFRTPETAYKDFTGESLGRHSKKKEFMLQDRYGKEWCWADDDTPWFKPKIKEIFSDYEILDEVFGKVNFSATFSGPTKHIRIIDYNGRTLNRETSKEKEFSIMHPCICNNI